MNIAQKLANFVFPAPRSNGKSSGAHRTDLPANQANNNSETPSRCDFTFSDGRRCRNQTASLCAHHSPQKRQGFGAEGAPDAALVGLCGDLTTATNINRALSHVFLLTAQGRISHKQAVAFGYLSQLLLQTVPGIRSEFVSVHGYRAWEQRLKSSLEANQNPEPSPTPSSPPIGDNDNREGQDSPSAGSEQSSNGVVEPEKVLGRERSSHESHEHQELSCGQKVHQELRAPKEVITQPFGHEKVELEEGEYYADIYRRSLDLLDRKFDTTPEGRSEANALLLELELMKPAPAKPRRDFLGQTADLLRRLHEHESEISPPAAPAASTAPMPPSPPANAPPSAPPNQASVPPATPEPAFCSPGRGVPQDGQPALGLLPAVTSALPADTPAHSAPIAVAPSPANPTRNAHSTDWYVPASWSGPQPDP